MYPYDFITEPVRTRVVVGMSGGVDSAVTAALLVQAGYQVVGITLELYASDPSSGRAGACCAGRDAADAARVAAHLGIPHYVLNYQDRFQHDVIQPFAEAYRSGETPVPCVLCNQTVKFTDLLNTAIDLGAGALATGHYARRIVTEAGPELHRAADLSRDQSYFLFRTTPEQLALLRFPLGDLQKSAVRELAVEFGLPVAQKPDSQDICFVSSGHYSDVVKRLLPEADCPGVIVDTKGRELGHHPGIAHFTVGQRRGLGLGGHEQPWFVVRLDPVKNHVVVGRRQELDVATVRLREMCFLDETARFCERRPVSVKLRSAQAPIEALFTASGDSANLFLAGRSSSGAAPGQAAVIYDGDRVIAGGWIDRGTAEARRPLDSTEAITDNPPPLRAAG